MGKLYLASRSALGVTVLEFGARGPVHPVYYCGPQADGATSHRDWGPDADLAVPLARALLSSALGAMPDSDAPCVQQLAARLRGIRHDVWIMAERELLDGLPLIV